MDEMAGKFGIQIIQQETQRDHIQVPFSSRPSIALSRFVNSLKSSVSRILWQEFPLAMTKQPWRGARSGQVYFLASTGYPFRKLLWRPYGILSRPNKNPKPHLSRG
ncbi:MAG: transposase [Thermodesulfovibrionales bacterium]